MSTWSAEHDKSTGFRNIIGLSPELKKMKDWISITNLKPFMIWKKCKNGTRNSSPNLTNMTSKKGQNVDWHAAIARMIPKIRDYIKFPSDLLRVEEHSLLKSDNICPSAWLTPTILTTSCESWCLAVRSSKSTASKIWLQTRTTKHWSWWPLELHNELSDVWKCKLPVTTSLKSWLRKLLPSHWVKTLSRNLYSFDYQSFLSIGKFHLQLDRTVVKDRFKLTQRRSYETIMDVAPGVCQSSRHPGTGVDSNVD